MSRKHNQIKKKPISIILIILGLILASLLGLYFLILGNQATTPVQIARKVGLRLPAYQITKADDNINRSASSWSDYYYEIEFEEPLSEDYLQKVVRGTHIQSRKNLLTSGLVILSFIQKRTERPWNTHSEMLYSNSIPSLLRPIII